MYTKDFAWRGAPGNKPFAVRVMTNRTSAQREVRGWIEHGYKADFFVRTIRAANVQIVVYVVVMWDNDDTKEG